MFSIPCLKESLKSCFPKYLRSKPAICEVQHAGPKPRNFELFRSRFSEGWCCRDRHREFGLKQTESDRQNRQVQSQTLDRSRSVSLEHSQEAPGTETAHTSKKVLRHFGLQKSNLSNPLFHVGINLMCKSSSLPFDLCTETSKSSPTVSDMPIFTMFQILPLSILRRFLWKVSSPGHFSQC